MCWLFINCKNPIKDVSENLEKVPALKSPVITGNDGFPLFTSLKSCSDLIGMSQIQRYFG